MPNPRVNFARYRGVFAPNHHLREQVTPARRGRRHAARAQQPPANHHAAMTGVQRLKRILKIDIETCASCGGPMKMIACIEDPAVIKRILAYLASHPSTAQHPGHPPRAPPQFTLPGLTQ